MKKFLLSIICTIWVSSAFAQLSGTYTIDPNGSGANNYTSFASAVVAMDLNGITGPVVFDVKPGVYQETVGGTNGIEEITGASMTNTITFQNDGSGGDVVVSPVLNGSPNACVYLNGADWLIFDEIDTAPDANSTSGYYGFYVTGGSENNEVKNCNIATAANNSSNYRAIYQDQTGGLSNNGNSYHNNEVHTAYSGIYIKGAGSNYDTLNTVYQNDIHSVAQHGIYFYYQKTCNLWGNDIHDIGTNSLTYGLNILVSNANTTIEVHDNKIHGFSGSSGRGIHFGGSSSKKLVYNNMIYDFQTTGQNLGMFNAGASNGDEYYYNTIYINETNSTQSAYGFFNNSAVNTIFKNNIIYIEKAQGQAYCLSKPNGTISDYDNNCYFLNVSNGSAYIFSYLGVNYQTINDWQGSGFGSNSIFGNPNFISINDPHINNSTSPTITDGAAVPITGISVDIDGDLRNLVTPDIGADEFIIAGPPIIIHTNLENTTNENTPYDIFAEILDTGSIVSAILYYDVNSFGTFTQVVMNNTTGSIYTCQIPAQAYGSVINYYIEATDNTNDVVADPLNAPANTHSFTVESDYPPQNLIAISGQDAQITLDWSSPDYVNLLKKKNPNKILTVDITSYKIYRSSTPNVLTNPTTTFFLFETTDTNYVDTTSVINGTTYYYVVTAVFTDNVTGATFESSPSNIANGTPADLVFPNPPSNLVVGIIGSNNNLTWDNPTTNVNGTPIIDLAKYRIYRQDNDVPTPTFVLIDSVNSSTTNYIDGGVLVDASYYVTSVDLGGNESVASNIVSILNYSGLGVLVFFDSLENANNWNLVNSDPTVGWAVDGTPSQIIGNQTAQVPFNGVACLNYNDGIDFTGAGANDGTATLDSTIDLTGLTSPTLFFQSAFNSETSTVYDQKWLEISTDNFATTVLDTQLHIGGLVPTGEWTPVLIDLDSSWAQIQIRFRFDTVDGAANTGEGWFVDDLRLFTSSDLFGPAFTGVTQIGNTDDFINYKQVSVSVSDPSGVDSVWMHYRIGDTGNYTTIPMNNSAGYVYSDSIPPPTIVQATNVYYYFSARDLADSLNVSYAPVDYLTDPMNNVFSYEVRLIPPGALSTVSGTPGIIPVSWLPPSSPSFVNQPPNLLKQQKNNIGKLKKPVKKSVKSLDKLSDFGKESKVNVVNTSSWQLVSYNLYRFVGTLIDVNDVVTNGNIIYTGTNLIYDDTNVSSANSYSYAITATYDVNGNNVESEPSNVSVAIPGGFTANITASESLINFGNITILDSIEQNLTIYSAGDTSLTIYSSNTTNSDFSTSLSPMTIPNGDSVIITVKFKPTSEGLISGNLEIHSNDLTPNPFTVQLSGFGNDLVPPSKINDFKVISNNGGSLKLRWTSTGDDATIGIATSYEIRFSTNEITDSNFSSAILLPNIPTPSASGSLDSLLVSNLTSGVQYYFGIKAIDNSGAESPISTTTSFERAEITSISDIQNDNGGSVRVTFDANLNDYTIGTGLNTSQYAILRKINQNFTPSTKTKNQILETLPSGNWEQVGIVSAAGEQNYTTVVSTLADSNSTGTNEFEFLVRAISNVSPTYNSISNIVSAYSIDNLPPTIPPNQNFTNNGNGTTTATWNAVFDSDLDFYTIWAEVSQDSFALVTQVLPSGTGTQSETFNDVSGAISYTVGSVDINGNESLPFANRISSLQIEIVGNDVVLNWLGKQDAALYKIYRSTSLEFSNSVQIGTFTPNGSSPTFTDFGASQNADKYFYFVTWEN